MNLDAYFARIGYDGPRAPTFATLAAVAQRHAMAIPFENLAVLSGGAPDLDLAAVEAKLVDAERGGYCYEQNALLMAALTELGFAVRGLAARVRYGLPPDVVTARSHMLMRVETPEGPAFADAGFGSLTLTGPVMMRWHEEQPTPHETVRLVPADEDFLLQALVDGAWTDLYRFDLAPQLAADYAQQNWHTATRPGALFASNLVVAMPQPGGRSALFNRTLSWRPLAGGRQLQEIRTRAELREVLAELFSLEPPSAELDRAWEVASRSTTQHPAFS